MKKTAIVTGGASGIGFGTCRAFLNGGFGVAMIDADEEALDWAAKELHGARPFLCDLADAQALERTAKEICDVFPSIDALVNNAVHALFKPMREITLDEWNRALAVNLTAPFLLAKHFEQKLRAAKGSIVNIASTRALMSEPDSESYAAAKGGIAALTHALAASLGPDVRVNAISPGWIDVSALRKPSAAKQAVITEADRLQHPAGRVGTADDIAQMVLYLCSDKSGFITGQNIVIDGGMTKKMIYV